MHPQGNDLVRIARNASGGFRNTWPQAGVGAALVVMSHPLLEKSSQVSLVERNQEFQTLAAEKIGLHKRIDWHTFRRTFGTFLNANGENAKVVQELPRHANMKVTTGVYMQPSVLRSVRAKQAGKDGPKKGSFSGLAGPNWTIRKNGGFTEAVYFVAVPDGI